MKIARLIASLLIFGLLFGLSSSKVSAQPFGCPPGYDLNQPEVTKVVGATTFLWHAEKKLIVAEGYTQTITTPGSADTYVWNEARYLTEPGYYTKEVTIDGQTTTLPGYYIYDISNLHKVWALKTTKLGYYKHILVLGGFDEGGTWMLAYWAYFWIPGDIEQVWLP